MNLIEEAVYNNPKSLLSVKDERLKRAIDSFLPYSTGFEIECDYGANYNVECFNAIPNIMEVRNGSTEQRYRIPSGLTGLICLQDICEQLRLNSAMNLESGIHYQVDCTDWFHDINSELLEKHKEWILLELDSWDYKGTYNSRNVVMYGHTWVRSNSEHGTLEFRCGEMSFDYNHLVTRIISANSIVRRLKHDVVDYDIALDRLNNELANLIQINQTEILHSIKKDTIRKKLIKI
jgi:hypothetical protein